MVDGRLPIEELEAELGDILSEEERNEDIDTLGGLVFYLADRVPARGELIEHEASGLVFEVVQADPRRVKRLRLRNVPKSAAVASPPVAAES
jgi:CBS domain containing-hemolysin-like protein